MAGDGEEDQYVVSGQERKADVPAERKDTVIRISGSGTMSDVNAKELVISGSGKITGSVNVEDLHVSGSGKVDGNINCTSKVDVSGSLKVGGDVTSEEVLCSGSIKMRYCKCNTFALTGMADVNERLEADIIEQSGTLSAMSIKCKELKFKGIVKADTIESDVIRLHGAVNAKRINADNFKLESMGWGSDIGTLEADNVVITIRKRLILPGPRVSIDEIRGETVSVEGVNCRQITAEDVAIGENCNVDYVEAARMSISGKSKVGEKRTMETGIEK